MSQSQSQSQKCLILFKIEYDIHYPTECECNIMDRIDCDCLVGSYHRSYMKYVYAPSSIIDNSNETILSIIKPLNTYVNLVCEDKDKDNSDLIRNYSITIKQKMLVPL